ncbi:hypothetical protein RJ639_027364 [Escallonia herrerae]|uniref:EF-hand domain-containing protein n=1 Tax=Escallonia herrerae TaxID=1293975 RepID=A0AA89BJC1_9ASTE|nr:hypothetical protein RJ639_027364 [Escallonia herrerae]
MEELPEEDPSGSELQENDSDSTSEEATETPTTEKTKKITEYERQRLRRIEENRARMEALGLNKMATSLMGSAQKRKKSEAKGKKKIADEDEEYVPLGGDEGLNSSTEEEYDDGDGEEFSGSRILKAKRKHSTPRRKVPGQNLSSNSDFRDDDDALMQAIALSLKDSSGFLNVASKVPFKCSGASVKDDNINKIVGSERIKEDTRKRQRKKSIATRVQMTEDQLIVHFFQFDEAGKGSIILRDLRRVAAAHDFTWSDKEMEDMIRFFDSDQDGKLSLDDFHKIVSRCKMIQPS